MTTTAYSFPLSLLTLALFPLYAAAASPWTVTDGSTLQVTSGYTSTDKYDTPLKASGAGSQLLTTSGLVFIVADSAASAAWIADRASLELNNATLFISGKSAKGLYVNQAAARINGSNIMVAGNEAQSAGNVIYGVNADIIVNDTALTVLNNASNIISLAGGTLDAKNLTLNGSAAFTQGGIFLNEVTASLETIQLNLPGTAAGSALNLSGNITGSNITIQTAAENTRTAVISGPQGNISNIALYNSTIDSVAGAFSIRSAEVLLDNVNVTTQRNFAYPAQLSSDAVLTIQGGTWQSSGDYADGVWLSGSSTSLKAVGTTFITSGYKASAVNAQKGKTILTDSTLITSGQWGYGLNSNIDTRAEGLTITTSGLYGHGVVACGNGNELSLLSLINSSITTTGNSAIGVAAVAGATIGLDNVDIVTSGAQGYGIQVQSGNARVIHSSLTATGDRSFGLLALNNATVSADEVDITMSGTGVYGLTANSATLGINNSEVSVTGANGAGLYAHASANFTAENLKLNASGQNTHALVIGGAKLNIGNSEVKTADASSVGLLVQSWNNEVTLDNTTLGSENGYGVYAQSAGLELTLKNGSQLYGGNGTALFADKLAGSLYLSTVNINAQGNSQITGKLMADSHGSTLNLTLSDGSQLNGAAQNVNQLTLDSTSSWLLSDNSVVRSLQLGGGLVSFSRPSGFSTLTVSDNLSGSGNFVLNTRLGSDTSSTDKLLIMGDATGSYNVAIYNAGGTGALTTLGIPVINVAGEAQSATFSQTTTLVAGNYQYFLNKVSEHDWYLQSSLTAVTLSDTETNGATFRLAALSQPAEATATDTPDNTTAGETAAFVSNATADAAADETAKTEIIVAGAPATDTAVPVVAVADSEAADIETLADNRAAIATGVVAYRPETAGYLIAPWLNAAYGFATAGSHQDRYSAYRDGAVWGRTSVSHDRYSAGRFAWRVNTAYLQLGGDIVQKELASGWDLAAGPLLTAGHLRSKNRDNARSLRPELSSKVGKNSIDAYGIGGYLSMEDSGGAYLDGVVQLTRYRNEFSSLTDAKATSYGTVISLEGGLPITLDNDFVLEPQLQAMGQYLRSRQLDANGVRLNKQNQMLAQLREGVRLSYNGQVVKPYLQADLVQRLGTTPGIKMNNESLTPDIRRHHWQTALGISSQFGGLNLYAQAKYAHSFGAGTEGYSGNIGLQYSF